MVWPSFQRFATRLSLILFGGMLLTLSGCSSSDPVDVGLEQAPPTFPGLTLTLGSLEEAELTSTIAALQGEWIESREAELTILGEPMTSDQLAQADVLVFAADRFGDLVEAGALAPLEERPTDEESRDRLVKLFSENVPLYSQVRFARPLGGSALVLVYRPDLLAALAGQEFPSIDEIEAPQTWQELEALSQRLVGQDLLGEGVLETGLVIPTQMVQTDRLAQQILEACAASFGLTPEQLSFRLAWIDLEPRVTSPAYIEALSWIGRIAHLGQSGTAIDPEAARRAFREGRAAMLIDRAEQVATWAAPEASVPIAVAPLPGSRKVYDATEETWVEIDSINRPSYLSFGGGWLAGISADLQGDRRLAAIDLVNFLGSPEIHANLLRDERFPMLPVWDSALNGSPAYAAAGLDGRSWTRALQRTYGALRSVADLRIPHSRGFASDFAPAFATIEQDSPPTRDEVLQALENVRDSWMNRIDEIGPDHLMWHYRSSLNYRPSPEAIPPSSWPPASRGEDE